jgi:O-antigen biosynthesis protein
MVLEFTRVASGNVDGPKAGRRLGRTAQYAIGSAAVRRRQQLDSVPYQVGRLPPLREQSLDPLFWRPARIGVESAWHGHIPFAFWLVAETQPEVIVELGTHHGVSYSAFCEAVQRLGLPCQCFAIDTWKGDQHAGFYGEEVYANFSRFHERYRAFSSLLRMEFGAAAETFDNARIDLLHIDGEHSYEAVRRDFETWLPKLSDRGIVLFHDTNVRGRGFGVWRIWSELSRQWPSFEFLHCSGLGVLAVGRRAPEAVLELCGADGLVAARVRDRFSLIGERCEFEARLGVSEQASRNAVAAYDNLQLAYDKLQEESSSMLRHTQEQWRAQAESRAELEREATKSEQRARAQQAKCGDLERRAANAEGQIRTLAARCGELERHGADVEGRAEELAAKCAELERHTADAEARALTLRREREAILSSTSWRITGPLRSVVDIVRRTRWGQSRSIAGSSVPFISGVTTNEAELHIEVPGQPDALKPTMKDRAIDATKVKALSIQGEADSACLEDHIGDPASAGSPVQVSNGQASAELPDCDPSEATTSDSTGETGNIRVLFVSGEPDTPGHQYRVEDYAAAARQSGAQVSVFRLDELDPGAEIVNSCNVLFIWRTAWCDRVAALIANARSGRAKIVFDLDDLMFRPELADLGCVDGIRTQGFSPAGIANFYGLIRQTLTVVDAFSSSTVELSREAHRFIPISFLLPSGFREEFHHQARLAARRKRWVSSDSVVRLGYAGGTRTHQKDFGAIVEPIATILAEHPECRLVLFREPVSGRR